MNAHDKFLASRLGYTENGDDVTVGQWYDLLTQDRGRVPCSRYGRNSDECAWWAIALMWIIAEANGDNEITADSFDYAMGDVVNDHYQVASTVLDYWYYVPSVLKKILGGKAAVREMTA